MSIKEFVKKYGKPYSQELGIKLAREPFKWFLASMLFGARISEQLAIRAYKELEKANLTTPKRILDAGWDRLVELLDRGGYVRYDFKTADKLLEVSNNLIKSYGTLENLHKLAKDSKDLEERLKSLGKGVGDTTVNIFLREMITIWKKARPELNALSLQAAQNLGIKDVKLYGEKSGMSRVRFQTALLRLGKNFCRKSKCEICPLSKICKAR